MRLITFLPPSVESHKKVHINQLARGLASLRYVSKAIGLLSLKHILSSQVVSLPCKSVIHGGCKLLCSNGHLDRSRCLKHGEGDLHNVQLLTYGIPCNLDTDAEVVVQCSSLLQGQFC